MRRAHGRLLLALFTFAMGGCDGDDRPGPMADSHWPYDPEPDPWVEPDPPLEDPPLVVESTPAPPPLSGGTLLITRSGELAWASSPDDDLVWKVDLAGGRGVLDRFVLAPGDEPGRLVEDSAGRIHVALRRGGAVATIDEHEGTVTRRPVCAEPRGIAFDEALDVIHVACASGDLVSLPAAGGERSRRLDLGPDLRDVVVLDDGGLAVTRFRSATLERLDRDGRSQLVSRPGPYDPFVAEDGFQEQFVFAPAVAWRAVAVPGNEGLVAMVHQRHRVTNVDAQVGGYSGNGCDGGIVHTAITLLGPNEREAVAPPPILSATLPIDLAVSPDGKRFAVAAAGGGIFEWRRDIRAIVDPGPCLVEATASWIEAQGTPIAVAYAPDGHLVSQSREPAVLQVHGGETIALSSEGHPHTGHDLFHRTSARLACASCHPEGREDGHIWLIGGQMRRTQTTAGGVLATAPFHWSGDMADLDALSTAVFDRMGLPAPPPEQLASIARWVETIPRVEPRWPPRADLVERGRSLFASAELGCTDCHTGRLMTNNQAADVGTGGEFQVPSLLGVAARAPFLHDGRVDTLLEAFEAGSTTHGDTSALEYEDLDALVRYLESL